MADISITELSLNSEDLSSTFYCYIINMYYGIFNCFCCKCRTMPLTIEQYLFYIISVEVSVEKAWCARRVSTHQESEYVKKPKGAGCPIFLDVIIYTSHQARNMGQTIPNNEHNTQKKLQSMFCYFSLFCALIVFFNKTN